MVDRSHSKLQVGGVGEAGKIGKGSEVGKRDESGEVGLIGNSGFWWVLMLVFEPSGTFK